MLLPTCFPREAKCKISSEGAGLSLANFSLIGLEVEFLRLMNRPFPCPDKDLCLAAPAPCELTEVALVALTNYPALSLNQEVSVFLENLSI